MTETSPHLLGDITLQDRVILITGAGSGISLALAKLTLQQGAKILIADLKLTDEASDFVNSNTSSVKFQQCDVTKWPELEALFPTSISTFGDVPDIVVPGAGVFDPPWSNFWSDVETESYKEVEINMNHVVKLTRLAFRAFVGRKKKGVVCSIASQAGLNAFYLTPLYCATKHAVVGFTRALAPAEPLEGIKVVTVCPGIAKTPILGDALRDALKVDDISEDRLLTTEDIAHAMVEASSSPMHPLQKTNHAELARRDHDTLGNHSHCYSKWMRA